MKIDRRRFLKRSALTAAALATPHPLFRAAFGPSIANAAGPAGAIVVLVQLEGGNDGLNTLIPVDNVSGFHQRDAYETKRPVLGIPAASLSATSLGADPVKGNELALHPELTELHDRFGEGKLAVVAGVGYPNQSLSHFRSEDIWFGGISSSAPFSTGWFGRWLASRYTSSDLVSVDVNETLNPLFSCPGCNVLALTDIDKFVLPDDPLYPDAAAKETCIKQSYVAESSETAGVQLVVGTSGNVLLQKIDVYEAVNDWGGSNLTGMNYSLAKRLREISSILRYDSLNPGSATGARYFHVRIGGFDTHTNQGSTSVTDRHPGLMDKLSRALDAFYQDTIDLGISNKVLTVTFSEFGRRTAENGGPVNAGTDHGAASVLFALGGAVQGGVYGTLPDLNALDPQGNMVFNTDFRQVYATVIDKWLGSPGDHVPLLGGSFSTLGFLT